MIEPGYTVNVGGTDYIVDSVTPDSPSAGNVTVVVPGATFNFNQNYTFNGDSGIDNNWSFGSDGVLYGPAEGDLKIQGIDGGATGTFTSADNKVITVTNGIITDITPI